MVKRRLRLKQPDYAILASVILLVIFGLAVLASASSGLGKLKFDNAYYYLQHQIIYGLSFGIAGMLFGYFFDYRKYKKIASLSLFISVGVLVLTFTSIGVSLGGASRWVDLGIVTIQPSELLKIFFILYLAAWLSGGKTGRKKSFSEGFIPFISISGIIGILLILQRSTSAAFILMSAALAVYFIAGAKKKFVFTMVILGIVGFVAIVFATPYRLERVKTFFNPESEIQGSAYQLNQAIETIGSGGVLGVGYGESKSKNYLPERIGDSIFAIIAEEFGFVGSILLVATFLTIVIRSFIISSRMRDEFGKLLLVGFGTIIGVQVFTHIGANSGLIPLTGVPLPFISSGGTALAVFMTMSGIMLNISRHT